MQVRFIVFLLGLFAVAACAEVPDDAVLVGTVTKVIDGDSVRVRLSSGPIEVRLYGIDAPERDQAGNKAATHALRSILDRQTVELLPVVQDRYDRLVAVIHLGDLVVNELMVEQGHAWAYRQYLAQVEGAERYCDLEAAARNGRLGLWADAGKAKIAPWDHRARRGGRGTTRDRSHETAEQCRADIPRRNGPRVQPPRDDDKRADPTPVPGQDPAALEKCLIKGNINSKRQRIYHVPSSRHYEETRIDPARGERWFCTEDEAKAAGWRPPRSP